MYSSTWVHKEGYTLELYFLMEMGQFSAAIFKAPVDYHIGQSL
jgi:hypothetical protein